MDVDKQVLGIWTATNGYTDDIAVEDIRDFEKGLMSWWRFTSGPAGRHSGKEESD